MLAKRRQIEDPAGRARLIRALDAQAALLPYALGIFAVSLPLFVWAASLATNSLWMTASFAIFAINWGAFYLTERWLRDNRSREVGRRARLQVLCGTLWAVAMAQISALASGAGPARESLLMLATAGVVLCAFFTAPYLPALLIVTPLATVGPLLAQLAGPAGGMGAPLTGGAAALALLLGLIHNRTLSRQHALSIAQERLADEHLSGLETAERMAKAKSEIVATLSHEIRNGLAGVTHVLAAAAGRGGRGAPSSEQLNAALDAAQDLIAVLNATLDAETAEAGRLDVERRPFDPVRLIQDLVLLEKPRAGSKGLELTLHVAPALQDRDRGATIGDPLRTRQIMSNLLGNAVKYTVRGRIEVRLALRGDQLVIEVADTGPGLTPEELDLAFQPFRRVERTGAGVSGAGLGLPLSRQLSELMGGVLEASSALGVGSCFTLSLPFDPQAEPKTHDPKAAVPQAPPRALRVLVAEDDALNAAMLRAVLEQLGHQVVHAQNGRRAVDLARIADFDLVMLDERMPVMDGASAAKALRESEGPNRSAPIIAVIEGASDNVRESLDAGADIVLRKPISVAGVARVVADAAALDRDGASPAAARSGLP